jgi:hypothetical protein
MVEKCRQKTLYFEPDTMPAPMTGYCIALRDVDLICVHPYLDSVLTMVVKLHELAHLLLNHLPKWADGTKTPSYSSFVNYRDHFHSSLHYRIRQESAKEQAAEVLATLLFARLHTSRAHCPFTIAQRRELRLLHREYIRLFPSVQLAADRSFLPRVLIEISDARHLLWSTAAATIPVQAGDEAEMIVALCDHPSFPDIPPLFDPPNWKNVDVLQYNLSVANALWRIRSSRP